MKKHWIIDAGHGGLDSEGKYYTDPKIGKLWKFEDGLTIYEGDVNRKIAKLLQGMLISARIDFSLIYHDLEDYSLTKRVLLANKIHKKNLNAVLLSIHSNAGKGKGFEVFTSVGETESDHLASYFCASYQNNLNQFNFRKETTDGDDDKEAKFTMLTGTSCPAILVENLFFDNRIEAEFLLSESGQLKIASALYSAIKVIEDEKEI